MHLLQAQGNSHVLIRLFCISDVWLYIEPSQVQQQVVERDQIIASLTDKVRTTKRASADKERQQTLGTG